jgi:hypothetical protein
MLYNPAPRTAAKLVMTMTILRILDYKHALQLLYNAFIYTYTQIPGFGTLTLHLAEYLLSQDHNNGQF